MRRAAITRNLCLSILLSAAGCATGGPRPDAGNAAAANDPSQAKFSASKAKSEGPPAVALEKVREELQFAPWEVALSGVRGEAGPTEMVRARNLVNRSVTISNVKVVGDAAALFSVKGAPAFPVVIPAGGSLSVEVALGPPSDAAAGLQRGALRFETESGGDDGPSADLAALVLSGRETEAEPSLQQIVEALGFAVDVGGKALQLPASTESPGDQIIGAALFQRIRATPVAVNPVARFSADGPVPYGYYLPGSSLINVDTKQLGIMAAGHAGTLNPEVEADAETSFDPGDTKFGLWVTVPASPVETPPPSSPAASSAVPAVPAAAAAPVDGAMAPARAFTENRRNRGARRTVARIFPLKARGGAPIPDSFLVAFGEAERGDYQDAVFVISNVKLAGR